MAKQNDGRLFLKGPNELTEGTELELGLVENPQPTHAGQPIPDISDGDGLTPRQRWDLLWIDLTGGR